MSTFQVGQFAQYQGRPVQVRGVEEQPQPWMDWVQAQGGVWPRYDIVFMLTTRTSGTVQPFYKVRGVLKSQSSPLYQ